NLAVRISDTAVHQIATGYGRCELILLGHEFPYDAPIVVEIDGINVIRERALKIHHLANNQRLPFMAPEGACGHRPGNLQLPSVLGIDLVQTAVAGAGILCERRYPLVCIPRHLYQILPSLRENRSRANRTTAP